MLTGVWPRRHRIFSNHPFDPLGKNDDGWYWYYEDVSAPTLWQAAQAAGLVGDRGVPVQEAERPLERERLGHLLAHHGVHVGAEDRQLERDVARERHLQAHLPPRADRAVLRAEQEVVEGAADEEGLEVGHSTIVPAGGAKQ